MLGCSLLDGAVACPTDECTAPGPLDAAAAAGCAADPSRAAAAEVAGMAGILATMSGTRFATQSEINSAGGSAGLAAPAGAGALFTAAAGTALASTAASASVTLMRL